MGAICLMLKMAAGWRLAAMDYPAGSPGRKSCIRLAWQCMNAAQEERMIYNLEKILKRRKA